MSAPPSDSNARLKAFSSFESCDPHPTIRVVENSARKIFKENNWPTIDVTRKSVEETAASVIKIYEIKNKKNA